jgi:hypothetical protein
MLSAYAQYLIFIYFNLQEIGEKQSMKRRRCTGRRGNNNF